MASDFLVEIGCEELPPRALKTLSTAFLGAVEHLLESRGFAYSHSQAFATPRRLAVLISGLDEKQADQYIEKLGPAVQAAFDKEGKATKAAEGFARSNGVSVDQLEQVDTDKGKRLAFRALQAGNTAMAELPAIIENALNNLPIPKKMRWGSKKAEFVRPVHWVLMLLGKELVDCEILGIKTGKLSYGHRFHHPQAITIDAPDSYEAALHQAFVIADFDKRQDKIQQQVAQEGQRLGGQAVIDADLLDEVTALVEWPVALAGRFEERFLDVPSQALVSSMKEHQKYFHVVNDKQQLLPYFITVANIESKDPAQVIKGNERVIRPRLADAAFFFEADKQSTLEAKAAKLEQVVFQNKLGSVLQKTQRLANLAVDIATQIDGDQNFARRAAQLSKADLVSEMVFEFEDLQGVMGYHYALHDGEAPEVAMALQEQYLPKFAGDKLPETKSGCALALADRIDTLIGIFGIGEPPTGNKDPYALRRASLGVLNIIVHKQLDLDLKQLLSVAQRNYQNLPYPDGLVDTVLAYMIERFKAAYAADNIAPEVFLAVNARQISKPLDFDQRVRAVHSFSLLEQASALAAANKRVSNILAKQSADTIPAAINNELLIEEAEIQLAKLISAQSEINTPLLAKGDYQQVLSNLSSLREAVDHFFDQVMVMAEDAALAQNRLALLAKLRGLFLEVADISLLVTK